MELNPSSWSAAEKRRRSPFWLPKKLWESPKLYIQKPWRIGALHEKAGWIQPKTEYWSFGPPWEIRLGITGPSQGRDFMGSFPIAGQLANGGLILPPKGNFRSLPIKPRSAPEMLPQHADIPREWHPHIRDVKGTMFWCLGKLYNIKGKNTIEFCPTAKVSPVASVLYAIEVCPLTQPCPFRAWSPKSPCISQPRIGHSKTPEFVRRQSNHQPLAWNWYISGAPKPSETVIILRIPHKPTWSQRKLDTAVA